MKIDGRKIAREISSGLKKDVSKLQERGITPKLVVILVGNNPSSKAYIRQKIKRGTELGMLVVLKRFPKHTSEKTVLKFITAQNNDSMVHGIIIQRPVPPQISPEKLNEAVVPEKDVDAFHPASKFEPPLALAVMTILQHIFILSSRAKATIPVGRQGDLSQKKISQSQSSLEMTQEFRSWLTSKNIVFLGRGEAGGKPVISHVEKLGVPHTVIHSQTEKPEELMKQADIIISAVGKKDIVKAYNLKKGVILIGIGLHTEEDGKLRGDFDEEAIKDIVSYFTPSPGGIGPINVAMLLKNVIIAAQNS